MTSFGPIRNLHFIGIGGAGMGGIAEVLHTLGCQVTGSDLSENEMVHHLRTLGITCFIGHAKEHVDAADAVVVSSAIPEDNPELQAARERRLPIVPRALMLAELMRFKRGIAVAGTHGKTTTTSLITCIFAEAGLDPTFVIGGTLNSVGRHAQLGQGRFLIAEADESDASFLHLLPLATVITNIDEDHMETYHHNVQQLHQAYLQFLHQLPFYGTAVLCGDDKGVQAILKDVARPSVTYGFGEDNEVQAHRICFHPGYSTFTWVCQGPHAPPDTIDIQLPLIGDHNVLNALAAITIAKLENIPNDCIQRALRDFAGVGRRCQHLGNKRIQGQSVALFDDYGHHPIEIQAVIDAFKKSWPERRLIMVFQPHRYSRLRDLFEDFAEVLSQLHRLVLLEVYSAGESPLPGIDTKSLARNIRQRGLVDPVVVSNQQKLAPVLARMVEPQDIILMQGAGDIGYLAMQLAETWPNDD